MNIEYKEKYLKYKVKYFKLKKSQKGGMIPFNSGDRPTYGRQRDDAGARQREADARQREAVSRARQREADARQREADSRPRQRDQSRRGSRRSEEDPLKWNKDVDGGLSQQMKDFLRSNKSSMDPTQYLLDNLERRVMRRVDTPGDGNCFFHSITYMLHGRFDHEIALNYRQMLSQSLVENPPRDIGRALIDLDRNLFQNKTYVESQHQLRRMAELLDRNITLFVNYPALANSGNGQQNITTEPARYPQIRIIWLSDDDGRGIHYEATNGRYDLQERDIKVADEHYERLLAGFRRRSDSGGRSGSGGRSDSGGKSGYGSSSKLPLIEDNCYRYIVDRVNVEDFHRIVSPYKITLGKRYATNEMVEGVKREITIFSSPNYPNYLFLQTNYSMEISLVYRNMRDAEKVVSSYIGRGSNKYKANEILEYFSGGECGKGDAGRDDSGRGKSGRKYDPPGPQQVIQIALRYPLVTQYAELSRAARSVFIDMARYYSMQFGREYSKYFGSENYLNLTVRDLEGFRLSEVYKDKPGKLGKIQYLVKLINGIAQSREQLYRENSRYILTMTIGDILRLHEYRALERDHEYIPNPVVVNQEMDGEDYNYFNREQIGSVRRYEEITRDILRRRPTIEPREYEERQRRERSPASSERRDRLSRGESLLGDPYASDEERTSRKDSSRGSDIDWTKLCKDKGIDDRICQEIQRVIRERNDGPRRVLRDYGIDINQYKIDRSSRGSDSRDRSSARSGNTRSRMFETSSHERSDARSGYTDSSTSTLGSFMNFKRT